MLSICKFTLLLFWMEQAFYRGKCSVSCFFLFAKTLLQKKIGVGGGGGGGHKRNLCHL
jgi:dihydroxyacetone kinase